MKIWPEAANTEIWHITQTDTHNPSFDTQAIIQACQCQNRYKLILSKKLGILSNSYASLVCHFSPIEGMTRIGTFHCVQTKRHNMVQITKISAPTIELDINFYRSFYQDMTDKTDDEVKLHWLKHGQNEGRFSSEQAAYQRYIAHPSLPDDFDVNGYLEQNPDVAENSRYPFQAIDHFIRLGRSENRRYKPAEPENLKAEPSPHELLDIRVDADFYRLFYADMKTASDKECNEHYFKHGRKENRHPDFNSWVSAHLNRQAITEEFSVASYIAQNQDLSEKLTHPTQYIAHYLNSGVQENRSATPKKNSRRFISDYYTINIPKNTTPLEALSLVREQNSLTSFDVIYLSAEELAAKFGIYNSDFLDIFDSEAYAFSNDHDLAEIDVNNYTHCLEHYLQHGIKTAANISYTHTFDPQFYAAQYKNGLPKTINTQFVSDHRAPSEKDIADLYEHWITKGLEFDFSPNLCVWAKENISFSPPRRIEKDIENYARLNPDLENLKTPGEILNHFISHGVSERRPGVVFNQETAEFFSKIAERLMSKGKRDEALLCYNSILRHIPYFPKASHDLADDLLRHKFYADAATYYQSLVDTNTASQWSYINLSDCYAKLSDEVRALEVLIKGALSFPDDTNMALRARKAIDHFFPLILKRARKEADFISIPHSQNLIRRTLNLFEKDQFSALNETPIGHVTIVGNHDLPQCRFYRIDQKIEHLAATGYKVSVFKHTEELSSYYTHLPETDAVIFYRVPGTPNIIDAINAANTHGLPTFYDMDDLLFDESLFPPALETYAGQVTREQHAAIAADVPMVRHAMALCRFGIASTHSLAKEMEKVVQSGKVFHHKNAFGSLHERMAGQKPQKDDNTPITIFYGSGTKAHKDDFHTIIEPVFLRLKQKYGSKIRFLVLGHLTMTDNLKSLGDQLDLRGPIWDTEDYWTLLRNEADINLSVLSSTPVTDAKSEIKWLEAAMFGIPSVLSRTATHQDVVDHGKTGFLCTTCDDFYTTICSLIDDTTLRNAVGTSAYEDAVTGYSIKAMSANIDGIMQSFKRADHKPVKKKIAVVNVFYPPQSIGGATRVVHDNVTDILNQFGDQIEICVFTSRNGDTPYEAKKYVHNGVRVTAVATETAENLEQRITDPQMAIAFSRFLEYEKPDLIHFHCLQRLTTSVLTEARNKAIPYVITAHDGWWISDAQFLVDDHDDITLYDYHSSGADMDERPRAFRKDLFGARHILAVSEQFAEIYRSTGLDHTIAIENGVSDLPEITRTPSPNGRVRLAHIGGMSRHKGFHIVKHALMSRPDFSNLELLVVDHARAKGSIAKETWGATPVTFVPKVPQDSIADLFGEIDVLLAPSIWPESYGLVTREALSFGCHVIASDRGAVGACVDHGLNGLVVSVDTIDGVRDALAEIDANHEFYLTPPETKPVLRKAHQQARDLVKLYKQLIET